MCLIGFGNPCASPNLIPIMTDPFQALENIEEALENVEEHLQQLLTIPAQKLASNMSDLENAKLYSALAYLLNSLFFVYLRCQGVSTSNHEILKELDRVKQYTLKLQQALKDHRKVKTKSKGKRQDEGTLGNRTGDPRGRTMDHSTAVRFIGSALQGSSHKLDKEAAQALRQYGKTLEESSGNLPTDAEEGEAKTLRDKGKNSRKKRAGSKASKKTKKRQRTSGKAEVAPSQDQSIPETLSNNQTKKQRKKKAKKKPGSKKKSTSG